MSRTLRNLGAFCARRHWIVIVLWLIGAGTAITAGQLAGTDPTDSLTIPGSDSQAAFDILQTQFPTEWGSTARIVFAVEDGRLDEPSRKAGIEQTLTRAARHTD
jgi:RND superfamily putative drug exporter